jgi:putative transcriptional regulator
LAIIKVTPELLEQVIRETDWARLDAQTDEEIAANVASDPDAPPLMTGAMMASGVVRVIRMKLGITQVEFSRRFRIPLGTLRDWEQNRKQPDTTAMAYLRVISKEPDFVAKVFAPGSDVASSRNAEAVA